MTTLSSAELEGVVSSAAFALEPTPSPGDKPRRKAKAEPEPKAERRQAPPTVDLVIHATAEDARRALADKAERGVLCGVDYETVTLKPRKGELRLVQVAEEGRPVDVIDVRACGGPAAFADLLGRVRGIAHNALYELGWNRAMGVDNNLHCTKVAARVVEGYDEDDDDEPDEAGPRKRRRRDYGLAAVAKRHLGVTMVKEGWQKGDWAGELERGHYDYAAADPVACLRLWRLFHPAMQADGSYEAYRVAIDAQPAVADMRERGVLIDREAHEALMAGIAEDAERLGRAFEEATGVTNLLSPPQLGTWLEERLRDCPKDLRDAWKRGKNGLPSTDKRTVASLVGRLPPDVGRIVVELLVPGRGARHSLANYGPKLAEMLEKEGDGRIRAEFQVASTASGRMSCNDPNLQQIPREGRYRRLVVAPPGRSLVTADYSQIELRLAAARAGEGTMLALLDDPAADLHRHTAAALFGVPEGGVTKEQRQQAKTFNFGLIYSMGATKLRENLALVGVLVPPAEAERLRERWFNAYPAFRDWQRTSRRAVDRMGEPEVRTALGRPRRFPKRGFRVGVIYNHPVQGTGAEGLYLALAELRERLREDGLDAVPVIANHDEIVLEASDEDAEEAARILEDAMRNGMLEVAPDLPSQGLVEAKVGKSWADKR